MPAKQAKKAIQQPPAVEYDEVIIVNVLTPIHFMKEGEETPSGNLDLGDALATDENGEYIKSEKLSIRYVLLLNGIVVDMPEPLIVEGQDLIDAIGRNPTTRDAIKSAAYDVLINAGIVSQSAVVS